MVPTVALWSQGRGGCCVISRIATTRISNENGTRAFSGWQTQQINDTEQQRRGAVWPRAEPGWGRRRPQVGHACLECCAGLDELYATNTLSVCFSFSDDLNGAGLMPSLGPHTLQRPVLAHLPLHVSVCLIEV